MIFKLLLTAILTTMSLNAFSIQDGFDAFENKEYQKAYAILQEKEFSGNSKIWYQMGWILEHGKSELGYDYNGAVDFYIKAAENKHGLSFYRLALLAEKGLYNASATAPFVYMQQAANLGVEEAILNIAIDYYYGKHTVQNLEKAHAFFLRGAELGLPDAFYYLGIMNYQGIYIKRDLKKAKNYFKQALKYNSERAKSFLKTYPI